MPWNYHEVYSEDYVVPGADLLGIFPTPTVMFLQGTGSQYSAITTRHQVELREETTISFIFALDSRQVVNFQIRSTRSRSKL